MKRLDSHAIGIDQGDVVLFSDFENDGEMWTGHGPRQHRREIAFSESYAIAPAVTVSLSMWDVSMASNPRADIQAENITPLGFEIVFRTWGDTQIARVRAAWQAIGELNTEDSWDI